MSWTRKRVMATMKLIINVTRQSNINWDASFIFEIWLVLLQGFRLRTQRPFVLANKAFSFDKIPDAYKMAHTYQNIPNKLNK